MAEISEGANRNSIDLTESNPNGSCPLTVESDCSNESLSSIAVIIEAETQIKSISFEEYNGLLQLIPKVAKLEMANKRLKNELKKRDGIIKEIQEVHKHEMSTKKTFPTLTMVNITSFAFKSFYYDLKAFSLYIRNRLKLLNV